MRNRAPIHLAHAIAVLALACAALPAVADEIITGPVDKAMFQAIVDAAAPGDTIVCLGGDYDFSAAGPVLLTKPVTIVAADPSSPPVFHGATDGSGAPEQIGAPLVGNTAFAVAGGTTLHGLTLDGLSFEGFNRTIVLFDGFDSLLPGCATVPAGLTKVRIVGNTIDNTNRGVQVLGGPHRDLTIADNSISANAQAIFIAGVIGCGDPFGGGRFVNDTERLHGMEIRDNDVNAGGYGILALHTENAKITGNTVQAGFIGIDVAAFSNGSDRGAVHVANVANNTVSAGWAGLVSELQGEPLKMRGQFSNNDVSNSQLGFYFAPGVNGWNVVNTTFSGIFAWEAVLDGNTYGNDLKMEEGDRVLDLGDNKVKFR